MEANQTEAGTFILAGIPEQTGQALRRAGFYSPLLGENVGQNEYRSPGSFRTGSNSTHVNVDQINLAPRLRRWRAETSTLENTISRIQ